MVYGYGEIMINKSLIISKQVSGLVDITLYKNGRELKSIRLMSDEYEDLVKQIKGDTLQ